MRPGKLTAADKDAIREAHAAGTSADDLAARYGVSRQAIYYHVSSAAGHRKRREGAARTSTAAASRSAFDGPRPYRDSTYGYVPRDCVTDGCGHPGDLPAPGSVQVQRAGESALWFCSFHCVSRYAIRRELAGADAA